MKMPRLIMGRNPALMVLLAAAVLAVYASYGLDLALTGKAAVVVPKEEGKALVKVSFSPEKPKVSEKMEIRAAIVAQKKDSFLLEIIVVAEDGKEIKRQEYRFSLEDGEDSAFTMTYIPTTVEKRSIVANLYNSNKTVLYDYKVTGYKAQSEVGPFDVEIGAPTNFVPKGRDIPLAVKMKNFGTKGVDANLVIDRFCFDFPTLERSMFLYLNASGGLERSFIFPSCGEEGQHSIKASLSSSGAEQVSSNLQFFERPETSISSLSFLVPDIINVAGNSSRELSIIYSNDNGFPVTDVRPVVFGVPSSWFTVSPPLIREIRSGESVVAVIRFDIPEKSGGSYPILVGASGDNLYAQKTVELKVTGAAVPARPEAERPEPVNTTIAAIISVAIMAGFLVLLAGRRRRPAFSYKLGRIKGEMGK